ncbi:Dead deah box helicase [Lasiodiplodia theobromae]|uniref:Dead deah box helicase n=1 Tax=Lasiodiplodia theobromae TaxID=45133 RepID=UPI0015C2E719|nr:Dead deah box helicase [Lasiodiplodia theobromae]KAF4543887.1 Dead deah box helicase [Lasiodiplodia theobromae]
MPKNPHPPRGGGGSKKSAPPPSGAEDTSYIVFSNSKGDSKKGKKADNAAKNDTNDKGKVKTKGAPEQPEDAPKKPDVRTIIGGASWTGKLPVNMLSEHCQKQKWEKPEYTMNKVKNGFVSHVILKATNPKTRETTTLPPIRLPTEKQDLALQPTALEARHFAATYTLFRVASMKNIHMMMPPTYKDLWKGAFTDMKKEDVKSGKGWMYEADPFVAQKEREQAKVEAEKKREEVAKQREKEKSQSTGIGAQSSGGSNIMRGWTRVPKLDMGKRIRAEIERLIRRDAVWNPHSVKISPAERSVLIDEVVKLGFRKSHVEEAAEVCKDREEILEWLLIHVPEDDLPPWSLPEGYTAGISMASGNLKREAAVKRLAATGYAVELCEEALDTFDGDEAKAAGLLQARLLGDDELAEQLSGATIADETYIRLSIIRQALSHAKENFLGEQMIFNIVDWLEHEIPSIIDNPGRLTDVSSAISAADTGVHAEAIKQKEKRQRRPKPWQAKQTSPEQQRMLRARQNLPAWKLQQDIVDAVKKYQVVIISGETGSGKSTQSVQFILDDMIQLDEVHERSLDTDFLLVLLRDVLKKRKDLRVILMSATLDADVFASFFKPAVGQVGMVEIAGRTHPVTDYYVDDVIRMSGFNGHTADEDWEDEETQKSIGGTLRSIGMRINYDLIAQTVQYIDMELGSQDGAILIFLPGTMEIDRTIQALRSMPNLHALPLHASLLPAEQRRVFPPPPKGKRKVIASTNVAETSITIEDVVAVIDTVEGALELLGRMGAIDGDEMTALGRHLAVVPADLRCAKLMAKREESKAARSAFGKGQGDLIADLRAYEHWAGLKEKGISPRDLRAWCEQNFLSTQTLNDITSTRRQYLSSLQETGFIPLRYSSYSDSAAQVVASLNRHSANDSLIRALVAGSFNPQLARIDFPDKKFAASVSGAVELDPEAKTIKYFNQENGRVFVHPSSTLFDAQGFPGGAAFMSYFTKMATSKVFIRDLTPFNAYSLLLFSGPITLDTMGRGVVVDGWLRLRGWARIGVLVSRLRMMLDDALASKIDDPTTDLAGSDVVGIVRKLVELDGLDR